MSEPMKLAVEAPNFSIVTPVDCNAKCPFCFWRKGQAIEDKEQYLQKLDSVLATLPKEFQQCSITGGEPTLLPWLDEIIGRARARFPKVVLSTNGTNLTEEHIKNIDHLNLSRHHYEDKENDKILGVKTATKAKLEKYAEMANKVGVDVTWNCVLGEGFSNMTFIDRFVVQARVHGATSVCFRKVHSDLNTVPVEDTIASDHKMIQESNCPACSYRVYMYKGVYTAFKYSVAEPTERVEGVYELIMQSDGEVTMDWNGSAVMSQFHTRLVTDVELAKLVSKEVTKHLKKISTDRELKRFVEHLEASDGESNNFSFSRSSRPYVGGCGSSGRCGGH